MQVAYFRFYGSLNDFLLPVRQGVTFTHSFAGRVSVKDMIESLGVPHPEIELILANGEAVDFAYLVQDDDRISIYPFFESLNLSPLLRVRPDPLNEPRFVLDTHLGRLAAYLRLLGFDTCYRNDYTDDELAHIASTEKRILLTRDRGLLKRSVITYGYCVRNTSPRRQLVEIVRRFDLAEKAKPFQRCVNCNGLLEPVPKAIILHRLDSDTRKYYDEFSRCQSCHQIYWRGTHYERMRVFVASVLWPE